jgi:hypothetical protein
MREEFRKELRYRLMQEAPILLAPRRDNAWTFRFLRPAMAVALAGLVLVAGAGTAAADSLPGDAAFPLKKAFEDLQVTLTFDDVQRVQILSQIADRRLAELRKAAERGDDKTAPASEEFAQAVARFRAAADAVQQAAPADKSAQVQDLVDQAREKHEPVLDEVQQKVSDVQTQDAIERAKDEENKDTQNEKSDKGKDPTRTARPSRSPAPSRSPRPSTSPRASEHEDQRTDAPRPTPRASGRLTFTPGPRQTPGASEKD